MPGLDEKLDTLNAHKLAVKFSEHNLLPDCPSG